MCDVCLYTDMFFVQYTEFERIIKMNVCRKLVRACACIFSLCLSSTRLLLCTLQTLMRCAVSSSSDTCCCCLLHYRKICQTCGRCLLNIKCVHLFCVQIWLVNFHSNTLLESYVHGTCRNAGTSSCKVSIIFVQF